MSAKHPDQNFTFPSSPVRHSESWSPVGRRREHSRPDNLAFSSPTLATLTRPTQRVLCPRWASARASQRDDLPLPTWQTRLTFPPAWRGLPVRCPKSYNLPSDAARAPPVPGFSSPYSSARLSVWQRSLGLMSWRWRWSPGEISRGWRPVGPVRRLRELSHCRQLGSSWPGLQPRCSSIGRQGSPVPMRWAIAGPRLSPPRPVAPKPRNSLRQSVGPTHTC